MQDYGTLWLLWHYGFTVHYGSATVFQMRQIVDVLPEILRNATPCDQLFNLLRNTVFQSSLFLEDKSRLSWPQFREHLDFPFPAGDSPLDFIADPCRAGRLYMEPRAIAEILVLRWIARAREFMVAGDFKPYTDLLQIMEYCGPSLNILDELATLDLSKICDQICDDQTFPQPPLQVIEFWKDQITAIEQCNHNYADGSDSESNE
ncbi:hypothetical protein B0H14DRAFT_2618069 [Mycena olivaceomarginata]|nr:hypothetical protein B0H14DRAFT_2618069 [Mycena olivaceomarginata]